jgi:hypothetical protein
MTLRSLPRYCIGIDLADRTFVASVYHSRTGEYHTAAAFAQSEEGFAAFVFWLRSLGITSRSSVIGMETTGVLSQKLCYYLQAQRWRIVVEDAARIEFFPNLTIGIITMKNLPENMQHISIVNVLGKSVIDIANPQIPNIQLDLSKFPSGIYYAKFTMANSIIFRKIIRQ